MSTGAVFTSFSGKLELFGELVLADRAEAYAAIAEALDLAFADPAAVIDQVLFDMFEAAYRNRIEQLPFVQETISAAWSSDMGVEVRERMARRPVTELIARALEEAVRRGQIANDTNIPLLSEMLWNSAIGMVPHAVFDRWPLAEITGQLKAEARVILAGSRLKPS